jgi:peptide/nickel transport system permease protein
MSIAEAEASEIQLEQSTGLWRDAADRLVHNRSAMVGLVVLALFVLMAVLAPVITPHDPNVRVGPLASNPQGPSAEHWFGLDEQGRDFFTRVVYGARLSLLVGVISVSVGLTFGVLFGAIAGYFRGWVDSVIMRAADIMLSVPAFLLAIALVTVLGRGLTQIMIAVGVTQVPIFARLLRGSMLANREADYVLAARSLGTPGHRILASHLLPNSIAPVIVQATLAMATAIIEVAGLSFVGLGPADPRFPEWGRMLADNANRLSQSVHLVFFPGFAVVLSVLALNLFGDGLRESIDPKLKG